MVEGLGILGFLLSVFAVERVISYGKRITAVEEGLKGPGLSVFKFP